MWSGWSGGTSRAAQHLATGSQDHRGWKGAQEVSVQPPAHSSEVRTGCWGPSPVGSWKPTRITKTRMLKPHQLSCPHHVSALLPRPGGWRQRDAFPPATGSPRGHIKCGHSLSKLHVMAMQPSKTVFGMSWVAVWKLVIPSALPHTSHRSSQWTQTQGRV